jgi:CRISPR/Cas system CSM-associated protein Csm3 (group 7 of RAMP superfamily)
MEENKYDCMIFLLRMPLVNHIKNGSTIDHQSRHNIAFFIPIECTHYVNVNKIAIENNIVDIEVATHGGKFACKIVLNEFLKYFDGAIMAHSPRRKAVNEPVCEPVSVFSLKN